MEIIKYKKEFVEKLRRMRKTNQISGKIIKKKKGLVESCWKDLTECWEKSDCECVYGVGMSDWFGNYL